MVAYWLVKSEPETWSWDDHVKKSVEHWDGVRNHQAANNMKAMELGDRAFFYHSGSAREVVGTLEVVRESYPDHTDPSGRFVMVDFKALQPLERPVGLAEVKAEPGLEEMVLVKNSRLSVQPVTEAEWNAIHAIAKRTP